MVTVPSNSVEWVSFQSPILSPGPHRLFVEYYGDNDSSNCSVPLVLEGFVVQNLTIPPTSPNRHGAEFSKGAIAGVVVGSVFLVLAIAGIFMFRFIKLPKKAAGPKSVQVYTELEQNLSVSNLNCLPFAFADNGEIQDSESARGKGLFANARNILITGGTFVSHSISVPASDQ